MMDSRRCQATTNAGKPCSAVPRTGEAFCAWHAADDQTRREWTAKGGHNRSNQARARKAIVATEAMTMSELQTYLGITLRGVIAGKIDPGVGQAVASIARAMATVGGAAELEQQLAQMRRDMADLARFDRAS